MSRSPASLLTLHRLPAGYRVLYSGILTFALLSVVVGLIQQQIRAGLSPTGAAEWILGNADRESAIRLLFARAPQEVLDEMWRRSLGVILPTVVLSALLFRSSAPGFLRGILTASLAASGLLEVLGPGVVWITGSKLTGWVWFLGQIGFGLTVALTSTVCLRDMWARRAAGPRFRESVTEAG